MKFSYERRLWKKDFQFIAGVDEVGRGPLAGPVIAAAVIFPPQIKIRGLADSKLLTTQQREKLFPEIKKKAIAVGIGRVSHKMIDRINIGQANRLAMEKAVEALSLSPDYLLIDGGRSKVALPILQEGINGGDRKCASIAAASIIAKVTRDRIMLRYHRKYSEYDFAQHKGYGTRKHMQKIYQLGPCPIHRRSFFPVSDLIKA